jgi:hypothetical protein
MTVMRVIKEGATESVVDARITFHRGAANGIAPLGSDSKVPQAYLPEAASGGHIIQEDGADLPEQPRLNFGANLLAEDDSFNGRTNISVTGVARNAVNEIVTGTWKFQAPLRIDKGINNKLVFEDTDPNSTNQGAIKVYPRTFSLGTLSIKNEADNLHTKLVIEPKGSPIEGDTAFHLYSEGIEVGNARFFGVGVNHGGKSEVDQGGVIIFETVDPSGTDKMHDMRFQVHSVASAGGTGSIEAFRVIGAGTRKGDIRIQGADNVIPPTSTTARNTKLWFGDTAWIARGGIDRIDLGSGDVFRVRGTAINGLEMYDADPGVDNRSGIEFFHDSASPAVGDNLGYMRFFGRDSANNKTVYADVIGKLVSPTDLSESGRIDVRAVNAGSLVTILQAKPFGTSGGALDIGAGRINWSTQVGAAVDTNLYRQAAGVLQSDHQIRAAQGLATKTKAGAIADTDFAAVVDGLLAVDTTNSRLYARIGGVWKSVALA